jgi:hypothetical protein
VKETLKSLSAKGTRPIGNYATRATACAVSEQVGPFWPSTLSVPIPPPRGLGKASVDGAQQGADLYAHTGAGATAASGVVRVRCFVRGMAMRTSDSLHLRVLLDAGRSSF